MRLLFKTVLSMLLCSWMTTVISAGNINVVEYGAVGDGRTLATRSFNTAIEQCAAAGGGVVEVPAGRYLCGSIRMKSNIELRLAPGAVIVASSDREAYDPAEYFEGPEYQDGGHTYFHNSLIYAEGAVNVSITGRGMIDGDGLTRMDTETGGTVHGGSIGMGDKALAFKLCRDVLIRDVTIFRGGHFAIIVTGCEFVNIDNVAIDTNRDGIDIDCCSFVSVNNCKVNTPHDDGIVLKSSYALKHPVACHNVMISNCLVSGFKLGTALDGTRVPEKVNWVCGRIKLGTESNGGFRDITISNCTCLYSSGIALEEVDRGLMENIVVSNITIRNAHHYPIYITTGCRNRGPEEMTDISTGRNITLSNIIVENCDSISGIHITGMPGHPLENITLRDIYVSYIGGCQTVPDAPSYPELGTKYPEISKFLGLCPAYGFFARHVRGLRVTGLRMETKAPDSRPAIVMHDVDDAIMTDIVLPSNNKDISKIDCGKVEVR